MAYLLLFVAKMILSVVLFLGTLGLGFISVFAILSGYHASGFIVMVMFIVVGTSLIISLWFKD